MHYTWKTSGNVGDNFGGKPRTHAFSGNISLSRQRILLTTGNSFRYWGSSSLLSIIMISMSVCGIN